MGDTDSGRLPSAPGYPDKPEPLRVSALRAGIPSALSVTAMDLLSAVANARYSLEYWEREVRIQGKGARWLEGPYQRGLREIETLRWIEADLRAKMTAQGMEARRVETRHAAPCEAREPGGEAMRPDDGAQPAKDGRA